MTAKKRRAYVRLLPSILCIAVTLFAGIAASTAWFSLNTKVRASGMTISMDISDTYLVIAKTEEALLNADASNVSVSYDDTQSHEYVPITHNDAAQPYLLEYASGVVGVDPDTGLVTSASFTDVPAANQYGEYYFAEFTVYIGALYCEVTGTDLIAEWSNSSLAAATTNRQKAATIDFYVYDNVNDSFTYVTATNLASGRSVTLLSDTVIPHTKSENSICICMRFYYDGALTYEDPDTGNQLAYIRTAEVVSSAVNLGITFRAEAHQTP